MANRNSSDSAPLSEAQKFDATVRHILSVSREELQKREKEWKRKRARRKGPPKK